MKTKLVAVVVTVVSIMAGATKPSPLPVPAPVPPRPLVAPAGTTILVRLNEALGTQSNRPGDRFGGVLVAPIVVNGAVAAPRGSGVVGIVRESVSSGRFKGRAELAITIDGIFVGGNAWLSGPIRILEPAHATTSPFCS